MHDFLRMQAYVYGPIAAHCVVYPTAAVKLKYVPVTEKKRNICSRVLNIYDDYGTNLWNECGC